MKVEDVITTGISSGRRAVGWITWTYRSGATETGRKRELLAEADVERFVTVDGAARRWSSVESAEIELW